MHGLRGLAAQLLELACVLGRPPLVKLFMWRGSGDGRCGVRAERRITSLISPSASSAATEMAIVKIAS